MTIEMKKAHIKKWLDYQVEVYKAHNKHINCCDDIELISLYNTYTNAKNCQTGIHINGVDTIAKLLDLPVKVCKFNTTYQWKYEHQIVWNGVVFYGLYKYEEVK